jgi:hypothetical protein
MVSTEYGEVDFNRAEDARQQLNRAKWVLFTYIMDRADGSVVAPMKA